MKLKEINFDELKEKYRFKEISIGNCDKWYTDFVTPLLEKLPASYMNKEIVSTREFFGSYIIELEKDKPEEKK